MDKNDGLRQVQKMFKTIDPDVVELVFNECQQKVDASVIQLSVIAEGTSDEHNTKIATKDVEQKTLPVKNDVILTKVISEGKSTHVPSDKGVKSSLNSDPISRICQHGTAPLLQCVSDSGDKIIKHNIDNKQMTRNDEKKYVLKPCFGPRVQRPNITHPAVRPLFGIRPFRVDSYQPCFMPPRPLRVPYMGLLPPPQRPQGPILRGHPFQNPKQVSSDQFKHQWSGKQQNVAGETSCSNRGGRLPSQRILFVLRGLPGSGKSTLARALVAGGGVIISTDDYFYANDRYVFNPRDLQSAHEWNQDRARKFMRNGITPVVIDNTNTCTWEMKPYIAIGLRFGYDISIKEPETPWKWNIKELSRRNRHGVSIDSLRNMLERYEKNVTVESIMRKTRNGSGVLHGEKMTKKNSQNSSRESPSKRNDVRNTEAKMNLEEDDVASQKDHKQSTTSDKIEHQQELPRGVPERDKVDSKRIESSETPKRGQDSTEMSHWERIDIEGLFDLEPYDNAVKNEKGDYSNMHLKTTDLKSATDCQTNNNMDVSSIPNEQTPRIGNPDRQASHSIADDDMAKLDIVHNKSSSNHGDEKLTGVCSTAGETLKTFDMSPIHKIMNDDVKIDQNIISIDSKMKDKDDELKRKTIADAVPVIEVDSKTDDSRNNVEFLKDCFSQIDIELLQFYLARCEGDLLRTVDCLLTYDVNGVLLPTNIKENSETGETSGSDFTETVATTTTAAVTNAASTASPVQSLPSSPKPIELIELDEPEAEEITEERRKSSNTFKDLSLSSLHLTLDPALALQLLEIFGSFNGVSAADSLAENLLSVEIDQEFAKHLYKKWKRTVQKKRKNPDDRKTVKNPLSSPATPGNRVKRAKFKTPPPPGYVPPAENDATLSPKNNAQKESISLEEIMDEQLAIHVRKSEEEHEKIWKEENMDLSTKLKRSRLHGIFPTVDKLSLNEIFEANNYSLDKTVEQVQSSIGEEKPSFYLQTDIKPTSIADEATSGAKRPPSCSEMETSSCYQSFEKPEYKDFRAEANTHYKLREECIKKAAKAYSKKQGQLAMVYARQAKVHGEQIKEANRRAAENIASSRNINLKTTNELDLHELHVDEALEILESVLAERENELRRTQRKCPSFIDVITGRGSHSRQGKPRIKPAVLQYVKRNRHRFRVEELNPGLYRLYLLQ